MKSAFDIAPQVSHQMNGIPAKTLIHPFQSNGGSHSNNHFKVIRCASHESDNTFVCGWQKRMNAAGNEYFSRKLVTNANRQSITENFAWNNREKIPEDIPVILNIISLSSKQRCLEIRYALRCRSHDELSTCEQQMECVLLSRHRCQGIQDYYSWSLCRRCAQARNDKVIEREHKFLDDFMQIYEWKSREMCSVEFMSGSILPKCG